VNVALDPATGLFAKARIAMGAVAPFAMRALKAEASLVGNAPSGETIDQAALVCSRECRPIDDLRASASYRRHIVGVLARRMLRDAVAAITS
jgi:carbon-monoxide dehydrogenase medium subunit